MRTRTIPLVRLITHFHHPTPSPSFSLRRTPPPSAAFSALSPHLSAVLLPHIAQTRVSAMSTTADDTRSDDDHIVDFSLSPNCSLKIQKGDITRWFVDGSSDAIVNAANERMLGGGGVDGAIHRAAGPKLREACYEVPEVSPGVRCPTGEARITPLPASHVIHTVGPIYDEDENPEALLESAYRNTLSVAKENNIQYVAFPAISCGVYGYPFDEAASIAISTVKEFANDFKEVHFVLFSDDINDAWLEKAKQIVRTEGLADST
ncbi:hypothetical protein RND81_10G047100 [Saponaria officinalis]|uniref:Macro domain-containing protein n=1 Tax=Saponaria officinalis TaxID=3572 RepID=A0AAW1HYC4_SAPOF